MRILVAVASASLALAPLAPAFAQAGSGFTVGAQVIDANGGPVGTVTAVNGDVVTIKTDKLEANLSKSQLRRAGRQAAGRHDPGRAQCRDRKGQCRGRGLARGRRARSRTAPAQLPARSRPSTPSSSRSSWRRGKSVRLPRTGIAGSAEWRGDRPDRRGPRSAGRQGQQRRQLIASMASAR